MQQFYSSDSLENKLKLMNIFLLKGKDGVVIVVAVACEQTE